MELAGPVLQLFDKLWAPIAGCWSHHKNLEEYVEELKGKLEELNSKKEDAEAILERWTLQSKEIDLWMEKVRRIDGEVQVILPSVATVKWLSRASLAKRVLKKRGDVDKLLEKDWFDAYLFVRATARKGKELPVPVLVGETAEKKKEEIWNYLIDDEVRKIAVRGMPGSGKTTIMKHINNRLLEYPDKFNDVIWVTASNAHNINDVRNCIASVLDAGYTPHKDETGLAAMLFELLQRKKRWVLIIDGLWQDFKLENMGIPEPTSSNGCKLLLTTRSLDVCRPMGCKDIEMEHLAETEAWSLFLEKVGDCVLLTPDMKGTAKQVADKCAGLPLAIITIAGTMRGVEDIYEWRNALEELRGFPKGAIGEVLDQLEFSYTRLKEDEYRQALLYCALYPEAFPITKGELIKRMITEGIVEERKSRLAEFDKGRTILKKLENASLLEGVEKCVKMHDLIREMAIRIIGIHHQFLVKAGAGLETLPDEARWTEDLERVSLVDNHISEIPSAFSPNCPRLRTLLLSRNKDLLSIPDSFFSCMQGMRLLDLSYTGIESLPNSLSDLNHLTALYLRHCKQLRSVPSLAKLDALMELDLRETRIENLPEGMEMLLNLRCLNLCVEDLRKLPVGILPKLLRLQYLKLWRTSKTLKVKGEELVDLRKLEKLECQMYDMDGFYAYFKSLHGQELNKYFVQVGEETEEFQIPGKKYRKAIRIIDQWYNEERGEDILLLPADIEFLSILRCHKFESLSCLSPRRKDFDFRFQGMPLSSTSHTISQGQEAPPPSVAPVAFPCLKVLKIESCPHIRNLFKPGLLPDLQQLEEFAIYDCQQMEEVLADAVPQRYEAKAGEGSSSNLSAVTRNEALTTFRLPKLTAFTLSKLPELRSMCAGLVYFPSLVYFTILDCPNLKRLPVLLPIEAPGLQEIYVQEMCWDHWSGVRLASRMLFNHFVGFYELNSLVISSSCFNVMQLVTRHYIYPFALKLHQYFRTSAVIVCGLFQYLKLLNLS